MTRRFDEADDVTARILGATSQNSSSCIRIALVDTPQNRARVLSALGGEWVTPYAEVGVVDRGQLGDSIFVLVHPQAGDNSCEVVDNVFTQLSDSFPGVTVEYRS